jgi:pimeloyl-ACP methyl ester carboxylesterase
MPTQGFFLICIDREESMPLETAGLGGAERRPRKRRVLRWIRYLLAGLAGLVVLLAIIGAIYQLVESSNDLRTHSPPGVLVEMHGYKMHLDCVGDGSPTVILESGLNDSWLSWYKVQPAVAKFTRVCSYDRAGVGWSDAQPQPPDSRNIALHLHSLLNNAGVKPPYVLVGHSIGGIHVRVYQNMYPSDVVGMVLIEPSHPDQMKRFPSQPRKWIALQRLEFELVKLAMPFGIPRFVGLCGDGPAEIRDTLRIVECQTRWFETQEAELNAFDSSAAEGRATGSLGSMLLVVLSSDPDKGRLPGIIGADVAKEMEIAWGQMQEELSHLSTRGSRLVAKGATHYVQLDRPDLVIDAVHLVVDASRNGPK